MIEKPSSKVASGGDMRLAIDGNFDISVGCVDEGCGCRDGWRALLL